MILPQPFHCAHEIILADGTKETYPLHEGRYPFIFGNSSNLRHQAQHVRECLLKGLYESPLVPLERTLIAAEIMESIRTQIGVVYEQDK